MKGWAPKLTLRKRLEVIRKWPVVVLSRNSSITNNSRQKKCSSCVHQLVHTALKNLILI